MAAPMTPRLHHADSHLGLATSMRQVAAALRGHLADGVRTNLRAMRQDPLFCVFLGASTAAFGATAGAELLRLARRRRQRRCIAAEAVHVEISSKRAPKVAANAQFLRDLLSLIRIAVPRPWSRGARLLLGHFLLLVMKTFLTVRCSKLTVYYLTRAIAAASWVYWVRWLVNFVGWMVGGVVINSGLKYMQAQVALEFRRCLTAHIHESYLWHNTFYNTSGRANGLDNPDQRITADLSEFAQKVASLFGHSFTPILNFVLSLQEASKDLGVRRPLCLFVWNVAMNGLLQALTPPLAPMISKEQGLEGDFRHAHARLISHAEEIAFLGGGDTERAILDARLSALADTQAWHSLRRIRKDIADQFFRFQTLMAGGIFIHIPFMVSSQLTEAQRISAFRSTEELMLRCGTAFGEILLLGRKMDELAGYTHRIMQLFRALQVSPCITIPSGDALSPSDNIGFDQVSITAPDAGGNRRLLVKDLSLSIGPGSHVLVTGPNGCGKTSIFRVLAGLWPAESGHLQQPYGEMLWLPQKPYLVIGTLRDQVSYPVLLGFDSSHDDAIRRCLETAGVAKLAEGPEGLSRIHEEWNDVLSGGERQRIGFARLYYHRPRFAVLDECTSAINPDQETALYEQVLAMGTTVFSIAHRHELRKFHELELKVFGDGTGQWELRRLH
eukprot:EG_transcript_4554